MSTKKILFIFVFLFLPILLINVKAISAENNQDPVVFKGKVKDLSHKHITIGNTNIILPKEVKCFDAKGNPIPFEMIKKGDHIIIQVERGKVLIKKGSGAAKSEEEKDIPR